MTPTKEQLQSIEWWPVRAVPGIDVRHHICPGCASTRAEGHAPDCWLAACLTTPDAPPAVEVGDVVAFRNQRGYTFMRLVTATNLGDERGNAAHHTAIYRPVWVKETPR